MSITPLRGRVAFFSLSKELHCDLRQRTHNGLCDSAHTAATRQTAGEDDSQPHTSTKCNKHRGTRVLPAVGSCLFISVAEGLSRLLVSFCDSLPGLIDHFTGSVFDIRGFIPGASRRARGGCCFGWSTRGRCMTRSRACGSSTALYSIVFLRQIFI